MGFQNPEQNRDSEKAKKKDSDDTMTSIPRSRLVDFGRLRNIGLAILSVLLCNCAGVEFHTWEGQQQKWPTAPGALVDNRYTVPTYYGYPSRPYIVIGVIQSSTRRLNRFALLSYAANRAKALGADAILAMPRTAEADAANPFAADLGPSLAPTTDRGFFSAKATVVAIKWKQ
jgi:hypothetical protein